jgi:hypothetical protein
MQVFQIRQRVAASGAGVAAFSEKNNFLRGMLALPKSWNTCIERNGD